MYELHLDSAATDKAWLRLLAEVKDLRNQSARVYRTFCTYLKQDYVLVTTSKDTCLALGSLSEWGRNYLCHMFEEVFVNERGCTELLFSMSTEDGDTYKDRIFVTRTVGGDDKIVFHLSPAR